MNGTRKRIKYSYRLSVGLIALTIMLVAFITDYLVRHQVHNAEDLRLSGRQRTISQRIGLLVYQLANTPETLRGVLLQELDTALNDFQKGHEFLLGNVRENANEWGHDHTLLRMYLEPPLMVDAQVRDYVARVRGIIRLSPAEITLAQPDVISVVATSKGRLMESLNAITAQQEHDILRRFALLHDVVVVLSCLALLMLAGVALLILRPAINYLQEAQEKLQELNALKGDFLTNMSHEIRTPMNGIFGMTELLMDSSLNARQQHYVRTLQNSADHLLGLINDILDFSKLEAGEMKLDPIRFNLHATIEDVLEILSPRAREKQLELLLRYAPDVPQFIVSDPGRTRQVLFNLIGNAIKFTDRGYVMVHVERVGEDRLGGVPSLKIRVEDTGIGIAESKIGGLFEKFVQVETGSARARQGTGLGLAISRNLVQLMHGTLSVTSTPGVGTVFTWQLPLTDASEPARPFTPPKNLDGKRLLLVDDLSPNRALFKETLVMAGASCLVAENAAEARSLLAYEYDRGRTIDAVLTDYMMPQEDGLQFARRLKADASFAHLPIVVLTSVGDQGLIKKLADTGVNACLTKPVSRQQLIDTIVHVLDAGAHGIKLPLITGESSTAMSVNRLLTRERSLYGTHILLVEDNRVNLEITTEILSRLGCKVSTAESGMEALDQVRKHAFDLIFMDCQMPEMDGFEAARRIVSMKAAGEVAPVPIVALTANALKGDRERCLESGMDDYLSKPVRKANLEAILLKWLRSKLEEQEKSNPTTPPLPLVPTPLAPAAPLPAITDGLDEATFINAREMLGDKLGMVITYYLEDAENFIGRMQEAVHKQDPNAMVLPAHTLKSSSRQLGANQLAELAARVEMSARTITNGGMEDVASLVVAMQAELGRIRPYLESAAA